MNLDKIFEELLTSDEPEELEAELESEANVTGIYLAITHLMHFLTMMMKVRRKRNYVS